MRRLPVCLCVILVNAALAAEPTPPSFAKKPTATKAGDRVRIQFAVSSQTDVAVFIEDARGKIIRHLVAGVLGKNPPPPLKANSLEQSIDWDGKADYGKPAGDGPFRARVAIGLGVKYDRVLISDPNALNNVKGLTVGPEGAVYALNAVGGAIWHGDQLLAFSRQGRYQRTLVPFPTSLTAKQVKGFGAIELRGRPAALVHWHRLTLSPVSPAPRKTGMAVTPDGKVVLWLTAGLFDPYQHIAAVGVDGSAHWTDPVGPPLLSKATPPDKDGRYRGGFNDRPMLAVSSDGKWAYVAGLKPNRSREPDYPAVFRVPLPARGPAEPFFGDWTKAGKGESSLGGAPRGLAVDGKGHLFIADYANDRVVLVAEKDARYVGEFSVEKPDCVAVDPQSGAVYVTRLLGRPGVELVKFSGWQEAKPQATLSLRHDVNPGFPWLLALDPTTAPPTIWMGSDAGALLQIADKTATFDARRLSSTSGDNGSFLDISVDRWRPDKEIYCRNNQGWWYRHNEATGKTEKVLLSKHAGLSAGGGAGKQILPAPDGNLYGVGYPFYMYKLTRDAKPLPWEEPLQPDITRQDSKIKWRPFESYVPVCMTDMCHTLGVRGDGHLFVLHPLVPGGRAPKALHEYLPTGRKVTTDPIIWKVSAGAVGPRFDAAGNIYLAEIVTPSERPYPEEFERLFGKIIVRRSRPSGTQHDIAQMYGSIVKFSPEGGMIHYPGEKARPTRMSGTGIDPFEGEPKLRASLKTVDAAYFANGRYHPVKVTGAEWLAFGYSHVDVGWCTCETTRFDVDEFGRVWYPDLCLFQVRVVDTNGNPMLNFGNYGNAESMGPDSSDKALAEPEIAFAWLVGVGVTDKYAYMGDSLNRRLLRARLVYAIEESADVR